MSASPEFSIETGSQIGYRTVLATVPESITLGTGNHFLLGRNGRGKTTLLRSIAGTLNFLKGSTTVQGRVIYLSEDFALDREMTGIQAIWAMVPKSQVPAAKAFADLVDLDLKKPFAALSTGNKRKLCLTLAEFTAAGIKSPILLLDEPYTGLDDHVRSCLRSLWEESAHRICRLIVAHPDQDSYQLPSALTITQQQIRYLPLRQDQTWAQVRTQLQ